MPRTIRVKTLVKFLRIYTIGRDRRRVLSAQEIAQIINCSVRHAYNYKNSLELILATQLPM